MRRCVIITNIQGEEVKLDQILEEMVIMNSRAELYTNFIKRKVQQGGEEESWLGITNMVTLQQETMTHYILLETHFMKQSIDKVRVAKLLLLFKSL